MSMRPLALASTLACALTAPATLALGGGSIPWEEARQLLVEGDPTSLALIEEAFELAPDGAAVRLGSHFQVLGGLRIPPYSFAATHNATGTSYQLTIHADVSFLRGQQPILDPDDPSITLADEVALSYRSFELAIGPGPALASPRPKPELTDEQVKAHRALIREVVSKTDLARESGELLRTAIAFGSPPSEGVLEIFRPKKEEDPSFLSFHRALGEQESESWIVYLHSGAPIFALHQSHSWALSAADGQAVDTFHESRYYLTDGAVYLLLEKSYEGSGHQQIEANRDSASNTTIDLSSTSTTQAEALLARLASAREASDVQAALEAEPGER